MNSKIPFILPLACALVAGALLGDHANWVAGLIAGIGGYLLGWRHAEDNYKPKGKKETK